MEKDLSMKKETCPIEELIKLTEQDPSVLIITQDRHRLSFFTKQINDAHLGRGEKSWLGANLQTFKIWLNKKWDELYLHTQSLPHPLPKLLDPYSEIMLWSDFVRSWQKDHGRQFLNSNGTARSLAQCWKWLCYYNVLPALEGLTASFEAKPIQSWSDTSREFIDELSGKGSSRICLNEDHVFFTQMCQSYCLHMQSHNLLSEFLLPNSLIYFFNELDKKNVSLKNKLIFSNFSPLYPQLEAMLEALQHLGFSVRLVDFKDQLTDRLKLWVSTNAGAYSSAEHDQLESGLELKAASSSKDSDKISKKEQKTATVPSSPFDDFAAELNSVLRYVTQKLEEYPLDQEIAIALPQEPQNPFLLPRLLDRALCPQALCIGGDDLLRPYQLYSGSRILNTPLANDLSAILWLHTGRISRSRLFSLLQNGFIRGGGQELMARSRLYKKLYTDPRSSYTSREIYYLAQEAHCPRLAALLAYTCSFAPTQAAQAWKEWHKRHVHHKLQSSQRSPLPSLALLGWNPAIFKEETYTLSQWAIYCQNIIRIWLPLTRAFKTSPQQAKIITNYLAQLRSFHNVSRHYQNKKLNFVEFLRYLQLNLQNRKLSFGNYLPGTRLLVMSLEKALQRSFAEIIVLEFNDINFPAATNYKGFLPQTFLAEAGYRYAGAAACLNCAQETLERLKCCAPEIHLCFANNIEKHDTLQPTSVSALWNRPDIEIEAWQENDRSNANEWPSFAQIPANLNRNDLLERRSQVAPPPARPNTKIMDENDESVPAFHSGRNIISDEANCPFKTFIAYRLGCREPDRLRRGFDTSLERGILLHECLKDTWKRINESRRGHQSSSQALKENYPGPKLDELIGEVVNKVLDESDLRQFSEYVLDNEKLLSRKLLSAWFHSQEMPRADFDVIAQEKDIFIRVKASTEATSANVKILHPELLFSGRVDRIDAITTQGEIVETTPIVIIDYKTGAANKSVSRQWDPDLSQSTEKDFQLPIYACFYGAKYCRGILFAKPSIREGKAITGLAEPGIKATFPPEQANIDTKIGDEKMDWDSFLQKCQTTFQELAERFLSGNYARTKNRTLCRNCHLAVLCQGKN